MPNRKETKAAYDSGRLARVDLKSNESVPFGDAERVLKHWWLAGWNDKDMELSQ